MAQIEKIVAILKREYPDAKCSLNFKSPWQLLVATVLSAQCTDERVNAVVPGFFKRLPGPKEAAAATPGAVEELIRSTGFFRNKALAIREAARQIVEKHGGRVPRTMEELTALRGVGRKTANVILGNAFAVPGIPVDTHVTRVSYRLGLTRHKDPVKIERDLMKLLPESDWTHFSHLLIYHGRRVCMARTPDCPHCPIAKLCPKVGVK